MPGDQSAPWVLVTDDVNGQNRSAVSAVRALAHAGYRPAVSTCGPSVSWRRLQVLRAPGHRPGSEPPGVQRGDPARGHDRRVPDCHAGERRGAGGAGRPWSRARRQGHLGPTRRRCGHCDAAGRVFPSAAELHDAAGELAYPVVVKAVIKSGRGDFQAQRIDSAQALRSLDAPGTLFVQPHVSETLRAVAGVVREGQFLALFTSATCACGPGRQGSVGGDDRTARRSRSKRPCPAVGDHQGSSRLSSSASYLLDVNPRVFGSMPLAFAAGLNLPGIACGGRSGQHAPLVRARPGVGTAGPRVTSGTCSRRSATRTCPSAGQCGNW